MRTALNEYPLFQGISEEDQKTLLPCINARFVQMQAGQTMPWQPEHTGLVLDGSILVAAGEHGSSGPAAELTTDDMEPDGSILVAAGEHGSSGPAAELAADDLVLTDAPVILTAVQDSLILKMERQMVNYPCWFSCSFHHRLRQNQEDQLSSAGCASQGNAN